MAAANVAGASQEQMNATDKAGKQMVAAAGVGPKGKTATAAKTETDSANAAAKSAETAAHKTAV